MLATPVRRLSVLIRQLPPESALWHDTAAGWSVERELSAATVEMLGQVCRAVYAAAGAPKSKWPKPLKVPRQLTPVEPGRKPKFDPIAFTAWLSSASPTAPAPSR